MKPSIHILASQKRNERNRGKKEEKKKRETKTKEKEKNQDSKTVKPSNIHTVA